MNMLLRFPSVPLGEIAEIDREGVAPEMIPAGTKYLGLEHIESGGRILDVATVDEGELASTKFRFGPKHLLFGKLRPYLAKIALPEFEGVCSTDILPVLPRGKLDRRYLAHFLRQPSMVDFAASRSTGANLPRLSPKSLAEFAVPLPPLAEQKRIAAILDQADALRRLRRRALDRLNTLGQAIFQEMFGEGSRRAALSDLTGEIYRYPTYFGIEYVGQGTPEIRGELIGENGHIRSDAASLRFIASETADRFPRTRLNVGDLVMSVRGTIGKIGLVPPALEGANITANLIRVAPDKRVVTSEFLWFALTNLISRGGLGGITSSTTIATIKASDLKLTQLPVADLDVQKEFSRRIAGWTIARARNETAADFTERLFASLQHRAFTGQL